MLTLNEYPLLHVSTDLTLKDQIKVRMHRGAEILGVCGPNSTGYFCLVAREDPNEPQTHRKRKFTIRQAGCQMEDANEKYIGSFTVSHHEASYRYNRIHHVFEGVL